MYVVKQGKNNFSSYWAKPRPVGANSGRVQLGRSHVVRLTLSAPP